jgi:hypothetical protein
MLMKQMIYFAHKVNIYPSINHKLFQFDKYIIDNLFSSSFFFIYKFLYFQYLLCSENIILSSNHK